MHGSFELQRQTENSDAEMSGENLGTLLRQLSKTSMDEIDSLIVELKTLHKKLQTDGDRIQRDIAEHAGLSQQVMQLTENYFRQREKTPGRAG
jgi:ElaB/YqjD/DUF883 family membrane-anchored ribosome-binding protein